ncbi:UPF0496 protein 4-like [Zingiber officinale]|uniref:BPS1-like protein n=1 Tax=Zingiber officinale TaxID=94328 RepID=A0A8J5KRZ4_ZINOF|nr:UPF0496 protein 4-like [Zingiber officinale]XP_042412794.1 UPF0496 protein 4-like [Zingiber officinale]KAG6493217.1 hypothetical protein ZIOFF_048194 [Zingiber officinale]
MSRPQNGQRNFFPFGNPFRIYLHKGSNFSSKLRELLFSFEKNLAEQLKKLKPKNVEDVFTLSWMRLSIQFLSDMHNSIRTLITDLQLPVSDWDEKWFDIYLDSSVKLLDICIVLSSELSRLNQGQLLLQYVLHLLDISAGDTSSEVLTKAHLHIHERIEHSKSKSSKLESCPAMIVCLQGTLGYPKVKSPKGKVLMRALHGVKVMTVFICGCFLAMLSGCSNAVVDSHVSDGFFWSEAFSDLQVVLNKEIKRQFAGGKVKACKEIEEVEMVLHSLTKSLGCKKEHLQCSTGINLEVETIPPAESSHSESHRIEECATKLADRVKRLGDELDSLSKEVNDFFQIVLVGRDALLCNLRVSASLQKSTNEMKS